MSLRRYAPTVFVFSILTSVCLFAMPPADLPTDKTLLKTYVNDGGYERDIAAVTLAANQYLQTRVQQNQQLAQPKKLAIVFDIDETSLSNYRDMLRLDFGGTLTEIDSAENLGNDPAIKPTLKLYQSAQKQGVYVFFVTGRSTDSCPETMKNMKKVGYTKWQGFYCKPAQYEKMSSAIPYKEAARKQITQQGYDIIISIGDQFSDLKGGYVDKGFKLPNPFYTIP